MATDPEIADYDDDPEENDPFACPKCGCFYNGWTCEVCGYDCGEWDDNDVYDDDDDVYDDDEYYAWEDDEEQYPEDDYTQYGGGA
jgi:hypothetical protein